MKRPLEITLISLLFVLTGAVGLSYHAAEMNRQHPFDPELWLVLFVRLLAIIGGVYLFRGHEWARWLLLLWLAYHVLLSAFHSLSETLMHALLLAVIAFFLFRPPVTAYLHTKSI